MKRCLYILILGLISSASTAHAIEIRIRGESKLEVNLQAAGTVAQVSGRLKDELDRGIGHRTVEVRVEAVPSGRAVATRQVTTTQLGQFQSQEELPPGEYAVYVTYPRNEHFDGVQELGSITLSPAPVSVDLFGPTFAVDNENPVFVYARAASEDVAYQGEARIWVGDRDAGVLNFDASGRGSIDIVDLLEDGMNEVTVRIPGSAYRDAAESATTVRYTPDVRIAATMSERIERLSRGLAIHGIVEDVTGPVPGGRVQAVFYPVELDDGQASLQPITISTVTDEDGTFSGFAPSHRLGDGTWTGVARVIPPVGEPVETEVEGVEVDTTTSRWLLNAFGILALLLGLGVLLSRGIEALLLKIDEWKRAREREHRQARAMEAHETIVPVFLEQEETTTPEARDDVGGVIWDVWQSRAVVQAGVTLRGADQTYEAQSGGEGRFAFRDVAPGTYEMEVRASGYVTGQMSLKIPHNGRFAYFRVDLIAVPLKIRRLYQAVLETAIGRDPWGQLSPRQIEDEVWNIFVSEDIEETETPSRETIRRHVERLLGDGQEDELGISDVLRVMTGIVEESYYSGKSYDESIWLAARRLLLELRSVGQEQGAAE